MGSTGWITSTDAGMGSFMITRIRMDILALHEVHNSVKRKNGALFDYMRCTNDIWLDEPITATTHRFDVFMKGSGLGVALSG